MKIIGLIVEYNPFHYGHINHINEIKKKFLNEEIIIIAVMSGNIVQRGEFAIYDKFKRTKIALKYGIDIILQLPLYYSLNSANLFAKGAISILNNFNVDYIIFGSEKNNFTTLKTIAKRLDDKKLQEKLKIEIKNIQSYPKAIEKIMKISLKPNDILGINYIYWAKKINSKILLDSIKRDNENFLSASKIREKIIDNKTFEKYTPMKKQYFILMDKFVPYFIFWIKTNNINDPMFKYFKNKINKINNVNITWKELIVYLNNKSFTNSRISRELLKFIFDIKNISIECTRLLGFSSKGQKYLSTLKEKKYYSTFNKIFEEDLKIANILDLVLNKNFSKKEINNKVIKK